MKYDIHRLGDVEGADPKQCGTCVAQNGRLKVTVQPTRAKVCKMFRRHRLHLNSGGKRTEIIVAELDGVFLYVNGDEITLTKRIDL